MSMGMSMGMRVREEEYRPSLILFRERGGSTITTAKRITIGKR